MEKIRITKRKKYRKINRELLMTFPLSKILLLKFCHKMEKHLPYSLSSIWQPFIGLSQPIRNLGLVEVSFHQ